jgi:hydroxyacylglutathione hydrolase
LVLILEDPLQWDDAVRQALRIGHETVAGHLRGGFPAWTAAGGEIEAQGRLTVQQLADAVAAGGKDAPLVIDVRQLTEYASGHVPGAVHLAAGDLPQRLAELPKDRPIAMVCASGYRSSVAASLVRNAGFEDVSWVAEGVPAWKAAGLPVERGEGRGARGDDAPDEPTAAAATAEHGHSH